MTYPKATLQEYGFKDYTKLKRVYSIASKY
jgi:hypothetical protein